MSTDRTVHVKGWHRWAPWAWGAYGALYVIVFLTRGEVMPAVVTAGLVALVGVGLAVEARGPVVDEPRQLGWKQDERQQTIHLRAMALVGYAAGIGAAAGGFLAFVADSDLAVWPMLALACLAGVYGIGLAVGQRRT